jgi:6-phosphofructokinase 1
MVVSFIGIPKTIDNDIPIIDQSFGFNTSCEIAS